MNTRRQIFLTILVHRLGYRRGVDIDMGCVTYQRFTRARTPRERSFYRAPLTCRTTRRGLELEREAEMLRVRREEYGGCLFARKFAGAGCNLTCFAASGFERFQCTR